MKTSFVKFIDILIAVCPKVLFNKANSARLQSVGILGVDRIMIILFGKQKQPRVGCLAIPDFRDLSIFAFLL